MPSNRVLFHLTCLGSSGGPLDGKTSAFLIKPAKVGYKEIVESKRKSCLVAFEAGSGLTAITETVMNSGGAKNYLIDLYSDKCSTADLINKKSLQLATGMFDEALGAGSCSCQQLSYQISNAISHYLISHSHLDHVCALVLNSPSLTAKGSKKIIGLEEVIRGLHEHLFNNTVWPDMISMGYIDIKILERYQQDFKVNDYFKVKVYPLSHGLRANGEMYISSAFLLSDITSNYSILVFGDVESDSSSGSNLNSRIWNDIPSYINKGLLNSILIECSTVDRPPPLYGHMTPSTLFEELIKLRKACIDYSEKDTSNLDSDSSYYQSYQNQPLDNFNIIITHVKETNDDRNPRKQILDKLNQLNVQYNTKINFSMALPGITYVL